MNAKSKSKKVLFIPIGHKINASSRVRVYNYKPFLEEMGFRITVVPYNSLIDARFHSMSMKKNLFVKVGNKINQIFKSIFFILVAPYYDVVIVHRILLPKGVFALLKLFSRRMVFDFDDAIYLADKWNKSLLPKNKFFERFQYALKRSNHIIVSNNILKEITAKINPSVTILPTAVDTDKLAPNSKRDRNRVVIGWIGSPETSQYLGVLKESLELLAGKFPSMAVHCIGGLPFPGWKVEMLVKKWSLEGEIGALHNFDIGIMPLTDDKWSVAKGGYKLLQYMSIGIPCVASPVGVNKEIIDEGKTGFFAKTTEDWVQKLSLLIEDRSLRDRIGIEGRKRVEGMYSYRATTPKLADIIESVSKERPQAVYKI